MWNTIKVITKSHRCGLSDHLIATEAALSSPRWMEVFYTLFSQQPDDFSHHDYCHLFKMKDNEVQMSSFEHLLTQRNKEVGPTIYVWFT